MNSSNSTRVPEHLPFDPSQVNPMAWTQNQGQPGQIIDRVSCKVYPKQTYQKIDGIGASFSEIGSIALRSLDENHQKEIMSQLFDPALGGFTFCRLPIGASDFGRDAYSLNDHEGDFSMTHFSVDRDREAIIPTVQQALAFGPNLKLHASPWSPPAWLKTTNNMTRGGRLKSDATSQEAYALYFRRYIEEYAKEGISIDRICQQNETDVPTPYPSCEWTPEEMIKFTVDHLYPAIHASGLCTEIWAGTFRMVCGLDSHECLANEDFRKAIHGAGFQYSYCDNLLDLRHLYPDLPLMHTESVCHDGANSWEQAAMLFEDIINYLRSGCGVYTYWNMILDHLGFSSWYWRQNSLIRIDTDKKTWKTTPDFEVMKLFSKHLVPGSKRVEAFSFQKRTLAIQKPDGSLVLFVSHLAPTPISMRIEVEGKIIDVELAPRSFNAIELS